MTRQEIQTISATFAPRIWTHPSSGEVRLYINGIGGAKVWLTLDESQVGGVRINFHAASELCFDRNSALCALDRAEEVAGMSAREVFATM